MKDFANCTLPAGIARKLDAVWSDIKGIDAGTITELSGDRLKDLAYLVVVIAAQAAEEQGALTGSGEPLSIPQGAEGAAGIGENRAQSANESCTKAKAPNW